MPKLSSPLSPDEQIAALREALSEARETIRQLQKESSNPTTKLYEGIKLTKTERMVLDILVAANGVCSRDRLLNGLYLSQGKECPTEKVINVMICRIRQKVAPHRVDIGTVHGYGYMMP